MIASKVENFQRMLGKKIRVKDKSGSEAGLRVTDIAEGEYSDPDWRYWIVAYQGEKSFHLTQGSYQVNHPDVGLVDLFLVPRSLTRYESVISCRYH